MCWLVLNLVIEILRHSSINRRDRKSGEGHGSMDHQIRTRINIISKSNTGNGLAFIWSFSHAFYCCAEKQENMQINKFAIILNAGPSTAIKDILCTTHRDSISGIHQMPPVIHCFMRHINATSSYPFPCPHILTIPSNITIPQIRTNE